ncbi:MauE/DoxX family redox-associated membrane protein [Brevibacillus porteri]|uniref:MauE/DoxX family redox-associated membrane protein n=1 Tax=Brevibacillus porteri TaxID=2126350 RepID=UPI003D1CF7BF
MLKHNGMQHQWKAGEKLEIASFIFRMILALLFISSSVSKIKNSTTHASIVKDYKILPERSIRFFAVLDTYSELLIGLLLIFGLYYSWAALAGSGLLLLYSVAIVVNLLRGRREISCGCGGIVGNHNLSWVLVSRNVLLIAMCLSVYQIPTTYGNLSWALETENFKTVYGEEYWTLVIIAWLSTLVILIGQHLGSIRKKVHELVAQK